MGRTLAVFHGQFGRATIYEFNRPFNLHAHREGHLLFYVRGAPGLVEVCERNYSLTEESAVAISPWEPHRFLPAPENEGTLIFVLYVNADWFAPGPDREHSLRFGRTQFPRTPALDLQIRQTLALFCRGTSLHSLDSELRRLIAACHEESWRHVASSPCASARPCLSDFRVRKSIRLMSESPCAELELDSVARASGLSRPHFYKLFREQTGVTPHLYLKTLLMEKALSSLVETEVPIAEIGFDLGFSSQSGFTKFFASNVGMAPTEYRRAAQVL